MFVKTCSNNTVFTVLEKLQVSCQSYFFVKKKSGFYLKNVHQACERSKYRVFSASNIKRLFTISHKTPCSERKKQGFRMKKPPK